MPYKDPEHARAQRHRYHYEHRAAILVQKRAYAEAHREERRERGRQYREQNKEKIAERQRQYYLTHKEQLRIKARARGQRYRLRHAAKLRERSRTYDPIRRAVSRRAYRLTHLEAMRNRDQIKAATRRARLGGRESNLTARQWASIKDHYGHRCVYCNRKMARLTQDHIVPLSKGGTHTLMNVVPACRSCNAKKYTGPPPIPVQPLLLLAHNSSGGR